MKTKEIIVVAICGSSQLVEAQTQIITFGDASLAGTTLNIPGSTITYDSTLIFGGTATAANHRPESGQNGTFGNHDGTFFGNPEAIADPSVVSQLGSNTNTSIDNVSGDNFANFVGIHLQFSVPISLEEFGAFDIDGTTNTGQNEFSAAYAYNSLTSVTTIPTISFDGTPSLDQTPATELVSWNLPGAPTTFAVPFNNTTTNNLNAFDEEGQVLYQFNNALVTDIYLIHGIASEFTGNSNNGTLTGVTGLSISIPVPEPSSTGLLGLGALGLVLRRKR